MSWLYHDSTLGEAGVLEQIASLQRQLDLANESIDDKLEKLENAGLGPLTLAEQLARARARIAELENELANLVGKDGLLDKSRIKLCRIRCPGCEMRFDANKQVGLGAGDVSELHTSHR